MEIEKWGKSKPAEAEQRKPFEHQDLMGEQQEEKGSTDRDLQSALEGHPNSRLVKEISKLPSHVRETLNRALAPTGDSFGAFGAFEAYEDKTVVVKLKEGLQKMAETENEEERKLLAKELVKAVAV